MVPEDPQPPPRPPLLAADAEETFYTEMEQLADAILDVAGHLATLRGETVASKEDVEEAVRRLYASPVHGPRRADLALTAGGTAIGLGGGALFAILLSTTIVWPALVAAAAIAAAGLLLLGWWYRQQ